MESEESLLRPCKSLPPPFEDHDALQNRTSPQLGSVSSTQGEVGQGNSNPEKEIDGCYMTEEDGVTLQEDRMSRLPKSKEKESATTVRKEGPLQLLDLPLDILKDIFKEVSAKGTVFNKLCANSTSRSHKRAICVVLPPRILLYILLLFLSSTADLI